MQWSKSAGLSLALGVLALCGCASTQIASVWKDPAATTPPFKKVMVVVLSADSAIRRIAEDAFVRDLPKGVTGVQSYPVLDAAAVRDTSVARGVVTQAGCDGVVAYRLVSVDTQTSYVPGTTYVTGYGYPYYGSFGGYYGYASTVVHEPGYLVEDQIVQIESVAYSVADGRLVWTARSETMNPGSAQDLIDDVVALTISQMRTDKVLP